MPLYRRGLSFSARSGRKIPSIGDLGGSPAPLGVPPRNIAFALPRTLLNHSQRRWNSGGAAFPPAQYLIHDLEFAPKANDPDCSALEKTTETYNDAITMFTDVGMMKSALTLLDHMTKLHGQSSYDGREPDEIRATLETCHALFRGFTRHSHKYNAAKGANRLLDRMKGGTPKLPAIPDVEPDLQSYLYTMQCWRAYKSQTGMKRTRALLLELMERSMNPTAECFNHAMECHAFYGDTRTCEAMLTEMTELSKAGEISARPNRNTYNGVLGAWAKFYPMEEWELFPQYSLKKKRKQRHLYKYSHNAPLERPPVERLADPTKEKVEALFAEMDRLAETDEDMRPDGMTFGRMIKAWTKADTEEGKAKAMYYLNEMVRRHHAGELGGPLDTRPFICAMLAHKKLAVQCEAILEQIFVLFEAGNTGLIPNDEAMCCMLRAWKISFENRKHEMALDEGSGAILVQKVNRLIERMEGVKPPKKQPNYSGAYGVSLGILANQAATNDDVAHMQELYSTAKRRWGYTPQDREKYNQLMDKTMAKVAARPETIDAA